MRDNDKKVATSNDCVVKSCSWQPAFQSDCNTHLDKKAVAAGTHRMYFIFFSISLTLDYISKAQHSSLFNVKSSVAARGWLSKVEQALDRP